MRPPRPSRPDRPDRPESREVTALKQIKSEQPDLATAVDLQLELVLMQRRTQGRIPTPWFDYDAKWLAAELAAGRPLLRFRDIPMEWSEARLMCRQVAELLRRYEAIGREDHDRIQDVLQRANTLEPLVTHWFESKIALARSGGATPAATDAAPEGAQTSEISADALEQVFGLAIRPFLARCADVILQRFDLSPWTRPYCPLCGGDPEMAVITPSAERCLICGRCTAQWPFDALACPSCGNADRQRITSFASRDGRYRLNACDVCHRYLKAYDARRSDRPVLLSVDSVATLPLDAAAIQKGYVG